MFVDRVTIHVKGGDGGDGCLAFRREYKIPKGGPSGGDGGDGGNVILRAERNVDSLASMSMQRHWKAEPGMPGKGSNWTGKEGHDLVILVPVGTIVFDDTRSVVLKDLAHEADEIVAGAGGRGGRGNSRFATSINRAPREFELGEPGESRTITLELKVIADVGLVGKPNAGKSTLLSRVSRAHPEIADYPFTTKYPNLGIVQVDQDRSFVMADIPGLIEGAHAGAGLGHEFLRHVERTKVFIHLVEPDPMDGTDPLENYRTIREELRLYDPALLDRPEIVIVTKSELTGSAEVAEQLQTELGHPVLRISAVTGKGLPPLVATIWRELQALSELQATSRVEQS